MCEYEDVCEYVVCEMGGAGGDPDLAICLLGEQCNAVNRRSAAGQPVDTHPVPAGPMALALAPAPAPTVSVSLTFLHAL